MKQYDIAAFVWPSYTGDEKRARIFWEKGFGEWQTVMEMGTKGGYAGCSWPRKPLWGYVNEADPTVMEMQIRKALKYGVNVFIYDWYWYDDRPFLENCLNDGFLQAENSRDMKFCLMWANHNADYLWDKRNAGEVRDVIWRGDVTPEIFDRICDRTIQRYFIRENYYRINGCPVYMVFDTDNFIRSFGSSEKCREAIARFREKAAAAGFPGVYLQCVYWHLKQFGWLPADDPMRGKPLHEIFRYIGFDAFTNYNWGGSVKLDGDYGELTEKYLSELDLYTLEKGMTFYPNLTVGWDNNVRFRKFIPGVVTENTPEAFRAACEKIRAVTDREVAAGRLPVPLITVNSWNEWTETSYLQPDDRYGYGYLEAIRDTFL